MFDGISGLDMQGVGKRNVELEVEYQSVIVGVNQKMFMEGGNLFFFIMIRLPRRSTQRRSSAASDVYKRQYVHRARLLGAPDDAVLDAVRQALTTSRSCLLYTSQSPRAS